MTLGQWLGKYAGEWLGATGATDPNALAANLTGSASLDATALASAALAANLAGSSSISATLDGVATGSDISATLSGSAILAATATATAALSANLTGSATLSGLAVSPDLSANLAGSSSISATLTDANAVVAELPQPPKAGDLYTLGAGEGYVWKDNAWVRADKVARYTTERPANAQPTARASAQARTSHLTLVKSAPTPRVGVSAHGKPLAHRVSAPVTTQKPYNQAESKSMIVSVSSYNGTCETLDLDEILVALGMAA